MMIRGLGPDLQGNSPIRRFRIAQRQYRCPTSGPPPSSRRAKWASQFGGLSVIAMSQQSIRLLRVGTNQCRSRRQWLERGEADQMFSKCCELVRVRNRSVSLR